MTTAQTIIDDALSEILVNPDEAPLESSEVQYAIRTMNRMITAWNFAIGFTVIDNPADTMDVPSYAEDAIVKHLAIHIAPRFDGFVSQDLRNAARGALASLKRIIIEVAESNYPSRLPIGSGNWPTTTFYPPQDDELVQEEGGSIILED